MKRNIWAVLFVMIGLFTLPAVAALVADSPSAGKLVLVIPSYHPGPSWTEGVTQGVRDVLERLGKFLVRLHHQGSCCNAE